jgi:hypothetical protein
MMGSRNNAKSQFLRLALILQPIPAVDGPGQQAPLAGLAHPCPTCSLLTKRALMLLPSTKVATSAQPPARSARQSDLTCHHAKGLPLAQYI